MRGRRELNDAVRGERRASVSSPLSGNESEEVLDGNRVFQVGYRHYVEPHVILFEGFPEGAMFRAPLDQEFLYPSRTTTMSDASRLVASQYLLDGRFVPGGIATQEGIDGCGPSAFGACMLVEGSCF
jgi:hypothetical protein